MRYSIKYTREAEADFAKHRKSGNKKLLVKINQFLNELRVHPTSDTGKPEQLKHYRLPTYSRRISDKHRLVYQIEGEVVTVLVLSTWGHYDDK